MGGFGMGGGSMYVNELLVQMDGMIMPKGLWRHVKRMLHPGKPKIPQYNVMVIGATNQASTLDLALLRPGRFDRKLHVGLPSGPGREDILNYYLDKVPHEVVDISRLARATYGFSPAQIKNLVNEALIFALVAGRAKLTFDDLWTAKVTEEIGLKEATKTSARDRQMTAFHEAGRAGLHPGAGRPDPGRLDHQTARHPRGGLPTLEERHTELREDMRRDIVVALGGLAAEEIWFGRPPPGPAPTCATPPTRPPSCWGCSAWARVSLSYGVLPQNAMGDGPLGAILGNPDHRKAIGALLAEAKQQAVELLRANEPAIQALSERLLEKDEVAGEELEEIMVSKAVARATPAWRPVLELVGDSWHTPALLEASPRDSGATGPIVSPPREPRPYAQPGTGLGNPSSSSGEFEW